MSENPFIVPCDGSAALSPVPATNRLGSSIASPQAGIVTLGSDYGASAKAQIPKVDAQGSIYAVPVNPAGGAQQVYAGQAAGVAASQYGTLVAARQDMPGPSAFQPLTLDMTGSLNVHAKSKPTFRAIARSVTCGANVVLFGIVNTGTMVLRLNECSIWVPPSGASGNLLGLGAGTTYYPLICELRRIAASTLTGGTSITPAAADTADTLAAGVACYSLPSGTMTTVAAFHRADAICMNQTGMPWYGRNDQNEKTMLVRPGEAAVVTCISNGVINNPSGTGTVTAQVDIELTFTQAVA